MNVKRPVTCFFSGLMASVLFAAAVHGQRFVPNYDEARVPEYTLPPLVTSGFAADQFESVWAKRRVELLADFAQQMYGTQPEASCEIAVEELESGASCEGRALRRQLQVTLTTDAGSHTFDLLVFTPANAEKPVPVFLGLNFYGNHTVAVDEEIRITEAWSRNNDAKGASNNRASDAGRGTSRSRWPVEMIVEAGLGVATVYCGDIDPDTDDGFENGVHRLFPQHKPSEEYQDRWGTISAWAWGLSRALDALQSNAPEVDAKRVVVIGHSRLGKTALWAGATDTRFAAAISNNSGCGGAAISRRAIGETVQRINTSFPHWFCGNFKRYNLNENKLPIDQHQLIALLAPRPVYVASATEDRWADPRGEFLATKIGSQIYSNFGKQPLMLDSWPVEPNSAAVGHVSYHLRDGKHDINAWDWQRYIEFMQFVK